MIYSDIARTLADSRDQASSVTQLRMIDKIVDMLADTLAEYQRFNSDAFKEKARRGYGVFIDNTVR